MRSKQLIEAIGGEDVKTRPARLSFLMAVGAANLILSACTERVQIASAHIDSGSGGDVSRVSVQMTVGNVASMARRQIYPHIVVFDCGDESIRYPATPSLKGQSMSDFSRVLQEISGKEGAERVELQGDVLASFLSRVERPCAKLEGGSYMGWALDSNVVEVRVN